MIRHLAIITAIGCLLGAGASGQSTIALSGGDHDSSLPIEMAADSLSVDQKSNSAIFNGNARVAQGALRLGAKRIAVYYTEDQSQIERVEANGDVIFTNGAETAEASAALYILDDGEVVLTGNVLLLQGPNALSGDKLVLNIEDNSGVMTGNVKSVFVPEQN